MKVIAQIIDLNKLMISFFISLLWIKLGWSLQNNNNNNKFI